MSSSRLRPRTRSRLHFRLVYQQQHPLKLKLKRYVLINILVFVKILTYITLTCSKHKQLHIHADFYSKSNLSKWEPFIHSIENMKPIWAIEMLYGLRNKQKLYLISCERPCSFRRKVSDKKHNITKNILTLEAHLEHSWNSLKNPWGTLKPLRIPLHTF